MITSKLSVYLVTNSRLKKMTSPKTELINIVLITGPTLKMIGLWLAGVF